VTLTHTHNGKLIIWIRLIKYARILVDMDLSRRVFDEIMVKRDGFAFMLEVVYERLVAYRTFVLIGKSLDLILRLVCCQGGGEHI
jgi:hypothetical protein